MSEEKPDLTKIFDGLDRDDAINILKHEIISYIDGNWGAGIQHIPALKLLILIFPEDEYIKTIYEKFTHSISNSKKEFYNEMANELNDKSKHPMILGNIKAEDIEAESIFRDQPYDYENRYLNRVIEKHPELKENISWWWWP